MDSNGYSNWLEIDLGAIRNNVTRLREISGRQVMAVVKADGYGHGALAVIQAAVSAGAEWCGVARLEEALALRKTGLTCRMLVLGFTPPDRIPDAMDHHIHVAVYDPEIAREYAREAAGHRGRLRLHLKVESGMGRLGIDPAKAAGLLRWLRTQPNMEVEGIFTHFARADEPDQPTTREQITRFDGLLADLRHEGICPALVHAANSAAVINNPEAHYDLIRPGIAIYGLHPSAQTRLPQNFTPALTWKTRLTSIKTLPAGHGISYGHTYHTRGSERIGSIAVGYGDGYRRVEDNVVLVGGRRVPVVGRVCMDQCMLQLDAVPEAQIGDEVVLLGSQGDERISAEELAGRWNTVNYEVICGLAARLPRTYQHLNAQST